MKKVSTGQALAGKIVKLKRTFPKTPRLTKTTFTGNDGCYSFIDLEDGVYKINVKKCTGGGSKNAVITGGGKANDVNFQCR